MTNDLENILDRIYPLRTPEKTFQSAKISKFSGGASPQTPLVAGPFSTLLIRQRLKKTNHFICLKSWTVFLCYHDTLSVQLL